VQPPEDERPRTERPGRPLRQTFRHEALLYRGEREFVDATLGFIRDGVARDEPTLVVVAEPKICRLREALGADADRVRFENMTAIGRNPACILPAWTAFVEEHAATGRRLRGLGEPVWPERTPAELVECHAHESLLNTAFDDGPGWWLICPYDSEALDADTIGVAHTTHPHVIANGTSRPSPTFREAWPFAGELPPPPTTPHQVSFTAADLVALRRLVAVQAGEAGLDRRADDLALAVTELAANSIRHGGGTGTLRIWTTDRTLVCEVEDAGFIDKPLVGRVRPYTEPDANGGAGLWLANHLCDLVQIRSSVSGSVVRLHMIAA
jgi:anti-sigma regulatory factor (Ser/Thr protein kinase)